MSFIDKSIKTPTGIKLCISHKLLLPECPLLKVTVLIKTVIRIIYNKLINELTQSQATTTCHSHRNPRRHLPQPITTIYHSQSDMYPDGKYPGRLPLPKYHKSSNTNHHRLPPRPPIHDIVFTLLLFWLYFPGLKVTHEVFHRWTTFTDVNLHFNNRVDYHAALCTFPATTWPKKETLRPTWPLHALDWDSPNGSDRNIKPVVVVQTSNHCIRIWQGGLLSPSLHVLNLFLMFHITSCKPNSWISFPLEAGPF